METIMTISLIIAMIIIISLLIQNIELKKIIDSRNEFDKIIGEFIESLIETNKNNNKNE